MRGLTLILRRGLAYLLDILLLFLILAPLAFLVETALGIQPQTGGQIWTAAILSFSIPVWTYFTLSDVSVRGASVGKRIMGVRVVSRRGVAHLSLGRAWMRTAFKLLPWEVAHLFGFAVADLVGERMRAAGLITANVLTILYFIVFIVTLGRRSVHDYVVGTHVTRREASLTRGDTYDRAGH